MKSREIPCTNGISTPWTGPPISPMGFHFSACPSLLRRLVHPDRKLRWEWFFDPLRREMFFAQRGAGAFLNDAPISVSREGELQKALLATGFPYYIQQTPDPVLTRFRKMCLRARGVRRAGSAALDLASVAAGRLDGFWEEGLSPWDTAAGILLVEEAGGRVTDFKDGAFRPQLKELLATNGRLHYNMMQILVSDHPDSINQVASLKGKLE